MKLSHHFPSISIASRNAQDASSPRSNGSLSCGSVTQYRLRQECEKSHLRVVLDLTATDDASRRETRHVCLPYVFSAP